MSDCPSRAFRAARRVAIVAAAGAPLVASACTSDLPAPDCYNTPCQITGLESATAGGTIAIDCSDIPDAALLANYDYGPAISGGDEMYTVEGRNVPAGLTVDPATGRITGVPEQEGMATVELLVTDGTGSTGAQICEFNVNAALVVDVDDLLVDAPFCVRIGETINDFIVDGTGDGTAITCTSPGGNGNGDLPAGISVNAETCQVEGTLMETRLGTYVWMVQGSQSGRDVFIPYCVTQDQSAGYMIDVDHSDLAMAGADGTLVPIVRRFNPQSGFMVGGGQDPLFTVVDPTSCGGNSCFYGFSFGVNASPFDVDADTLLDPNMLLNNMAGDPIGFTHELQLSGPNPDSAPTFAEDFGDRPFVVNISVDYCINAVEAECMGSMNITNNGDGGIEMAVVMYPQ